jgi:membrane protein CcdC involved in cytochrome C biogenesis
MRNWNIKNLLGLTLAILSTIRLAFAGLLLWAFQETDTPALRLSLWVIAMGMIGYVIWRIIKMYQFLKFDKTLDFKE